MVLFQSFCAARLCGFGLLVQQPHRGHPRGGGGCEQGKQLKGLSHEKDFKNIDKNLQNLAEETRLF